MKKIKKIAAGLIAVTAMATSMTGISVSAGDNTKSYNFYCACAPNYAPGGTDTPDNWTMAATTAQYTGHCTSMSNIPTRALHIRSSTHTMYGNELTYYNQNYFNEYRAIFNATGYIHWNLYGSLTAVSYSAFCFGGSNGLVCQGNVSV